MEILVAIAIVLTIAAIVVPVYRSSISQSKRTACTVNMRQIASAAQMYKRDNDDALPLKMFYDFRPLLSYLVDPALCKCPEDRTRHGVNFQAGAKLGSPVSYISVLTDEPVFMEKLTQLDPNYGLIACVSHGSRRNRTEGPPYLYDYYGPILRSRIDSSVKYVNWTGHCYKKKDGSIEYHRLYWGLFTDVDPPQEVVDLMSANEFERVPCPE